MASGRGAERGAGRRLLPASAGLRSVRQCAPTATKPPASKVALFWFRTKLRRRLELRPLMVAARVTALSP